METVKVDIQKLQLLNDRVAQTIDALNQLRLSVHGIHQTQQAFGGYGYSPVTPFAQSPLAHQTPYTQPFVPYGAQFSPYGGSPYGQYPVNLQHTQATTTPFTVGVMPFASQPNGLSHTTWDPSWQSWQRPWPVMINQW
jgi:hypothetical protein